MALLKVTDIYIVFVPLISTDVWERQECTPLDNKTDGKGNSYLETASRRKIKSW